MPQSTAENYPQSSRTALWQRFSQSQPSQDFYLTWLSLLALQLPHSVRAVLVLGEPDSGRYRPAAYWPEGHGGSAHLGQLAERVLAARQGMAGQLDESGQRIGFACPILIDEHLHGVVAVETGAQVNAESLDQLLKQLRWGCGWLESYLRGEQSKQDAHLHQRLVTALELIVSVLELPGYQASSKALVTELAQRLHCDRVSIGLRHRNYIRVEAISHSAELDKQMNMVRAIGQAMDEAFDQCQPLSWPANGKDEYILRKHEALAQQFASQAIVTIPLYVYGEAIGALTLERSAGEPFNDADMEICRSVASVVTPIIHEKKLNDRSLLQKFGGAVKDKLTHWLGAENYLRKLLTLSLTLIVLAAFVVNGDYRVTADTVIEGKVQRSIITPFDGYIAEAEARAGDVVKEGQLLALLADKDLQLERLKWLSQRGQLSKQYDEAMALRERAKVNIINAQIDQAEAQLNLAEEKLARTRVLAPFDGLIISGDLNQTLGGSVAQGELLFVIAPLDDYRVVLQVDERYIQQLQAGQTGTLVLSSLPGEKLAITVERITPVSTAEEGVNYFRVEAVLAQHSAQLRPGMAGVAKVYIGQRSLAWIWTHEIINWFQLWAWRWLP